MLRKSQLQPASLIEASNNSAETPNTAAAKRTSRRLRNTNTNMTTNTPTMGTNTDRTSRITSGLTAGPKVCHPVS